MRAPGDAPRLSGLKIVAALWCLLAAAAQAATWHVAQGHPAASDENDGSAEAPWKTIGRGVKGAGPGDVVVIGSGVYREAVKIERNGENGRPIRFEAEAAARVVVTGADRLTEWKKEGKTDNIFSTPWPHEFVGWTKNHAHPDDEYHRLIGRVEQVFVLGYGLRQVLRREELARGTFHVDEADKRLYVWSADNRDLANDDVLVEAATRGVVWESRGDFVEVRGLRFCYAANRAQEGAAQFAGRDNVVEDCVFERTNGVGASFLGERATVRRCTFQDNGQMGFGAYRAHGSAFTGCLVRNNNTKGYDRGWEAGGDKIVLTRGLVLEGCRFVENRGHGVWFDIGNEDCVVRHCLIADNEDAGIFYEISYGLHAHDNVIVGNGFAETPGGWCAGAGIVLSSSPGCVVERNLIVGNKEGFNFREQGRTTARIEHAEGAAEERVWNHDEIVRNNVIAWNRDAQTRGWFDVDEGAPVGAAMEKLKLTFENNLYAARAGGELFVWGVPWRRHSAHATLDAVRAELKLERGSVEGPVEFGDYLRRDFRVRSESPALKMKAYPEGAAPGVELGVLPGS